MANVIHRTTLQFIASANEPDYPEPVWKWSPDMSAVVGVPVYFQKWDAVAERPIPMTQGEQDTVTAARLAAAREAAAAVLDGVENITRAFMLLVLDEFNAHSAKMNALLTAIDGAATLAALKTTVGTIADLPTRTAQQLRDAIKNKLGS